MNYLKIQRRVAINLDKDNISELIAEIINEVRDELAADIPLKFLHTQKTIPIVSATYSYKIDTGATTSRYGGNLVSIKYDDNSSAEPYDMVYLATEEFYNNYPSQGTGTPTAFTVKGDTFYVNNLPSTITSKNFITSYFSLPDKLSSDKDESYLEKVYSEFVIAKSCERLYLEYLKEGVESSKWAAYWSARAKQTRSYILRSEMYGMDVDSVINTGGL